MSDHTLDAYEIYGLPQDVGGEISTVHDYIAGLREDLGKAEERIRELEEQHAADVRRLWSHIGNMPGGV